MLDKARLTLLRWQLSNNLPLIGNSLQERAAAQLLAFARQGNHDATQALAEAALLPFPHTQQLAANTLRANLHTLCLDPVWKVWARTYSPVLAEVLRQGGSPAAAKNGVRLHVLSLLLLGQVPTLKSNEKVTRALLEGLQIKDPILSGTAHKALTQLQDADSIRLVCEQARQNNDPLLQQIIIEGRLLPEDPLELRIWAALLTQQTDTLAQLGPEAIPHLLEALHTPRLSGAARTTLLHLQNPQAVRVFCQRWFETRAPELESILTEAAYLPAQPPQLRLYCALKTGNRLAANNSPASVVPGLLKALEDDDPTLRSAAEDALLHLQRPEARNALCLAFLNDNDPTAARLAQKAGYLPIKAQDQAAYLLLTGQWQALAELDFDQRLNRTAYQTATPELRQRMARAVQQSGRPELLTILTSFAAAEPERMSRNEADILVESLRSLGDWPRLWQVARQLPLEQAMRSVRILAEQAWQPEDGLQQALYAQLRQHCQVAPSDLNMQTLMTAFPAAMPRALMRVSGRINEISFAPNRPILALASSAGKVVHWNFQQARIEQVQRGFYYSIHLLAHTPDGRLLCAERTSNTLYELFSDGRPPRPILKSNSGITNLLILDSQTCLCTHRDGTVRIIPLDAPSTGNIARYPEWLWARGACLSPNHQSAVLLSHHLVFVNLQTLEYSLLFNSNSNQSKINRSVARCACFTPEGGLILGQHNGQMIEYSTFNNTSQNSRHLVTEYNARAEAVTFLPDTDLLLCAWNDGQMQLLHWPQNTLFSNLSTPNGSLLSLQISPDGSFLACGALNHFSLWDLRTLTLPEMIARPIASLTPKQLAALNELLPLMENSISPETQAPLRFLYAALEERFRYEISIEELPGIQPGEFDIMIDEDN